MPDKHLETENKDYYPEKPILWIIVELTSLIRLQNVALRTSFRNVYPANTQQTLKVHNFECLLERVS